MDSSFINVAGQRLEYREWSGRTDRPALLLLHEGLGSVSLWRDFPERLASHTGRRVVAYSRAGYGRSSPVPLPRPLTYMHDEARIVLPALLDALDLGNVVLTGHSDGASIAAIHAGDTVHPSVRAIVLMAPHFFVEDVSVASIAQAEEAYETSDLRERLLKHHGANVDCAFRGWNDAWLDPDFRRWDITAFLPPIEVPVLVIQGAEDEYGTLAQVEIAKAGIKAPLETLVLERCGHSPHRDRPEATLSAIAAFADRVAVPPISRPR